MSALAPAGLVQSTSAARSKTFAVAMTVTAILAFVGFWPTYFGPLLLGTVEARFLVHLHAAVMVTWLTLFAAQIYFAISGRIGLHIRFGPWAMAFSAVFLLLSLALTLDVFGRNIESGQIALGQRKLFGHLREVVFMGAWFAAGWAYRHKLETHKRIMAAAAVMIIYPAIGRMRYFLGEPIPLLTWMIIWPLPIYLLMIHDFVKKRIVHPVYLYALLTMLAVRLVLPFNSSETWMSMSSWFVPFFQSSGVGH